MQFQYFRGFRGFYSQIFFSFGLASSVLLNGAHTIHTHTCTHKHTQVNEITYYACVCFHALLCGCGCVCGVYSVGENIKDKVKAEKKKPAKKSLKPLKKHEIELSHIMLSCNSANCKIALDTYTTYKVEVPGAFCRSSIPTFWKFCVSNFLFFYRSL